MGPRAPSGARESSLSGSPTLKLGDGRVYAVTRDGDCIFATGLRGAKYVYLPYSTGDGDQGHFYGLGCRSIPGTVHRTQLEALIDQAVA